MSSTFPSDFLWGTASSSYQIEGAFDQDGRGLSIWDTFSKTAGCVNNGDTGDVACDHYNRFIEDIGIMQELGIKAYRFSISWPRLFPNGDDEREERGFDFYNHLIDELIAAGIEPMVTLYHWDLPQKLEDAGGWANRKTIDAFAHYAKAAAEAFGDRVKSWITLNEPWCTAWLGYANGVHAPGKKDMDLAIIASHHTALAHAAGLRAIKSVCPDVEVGLTVNMANHQLEDPKNAELIELAQLLDSNLNRWWIDAFLTGKYPENLLQNYGERIASVILPGDEELLKVTTDFLGINYYRDEFVGLPKVTTKPLLEDGLFPFSHRADMSVPSTYTGTYTSMGWPITPEGLGKLLERVHRDWPQIPYLMVTENGAAFDDLKKSDEIIDDYDRIAYLTEHIASVERAIAAGVPVRGYFAWSIMDNFEWAEGYAKRFGLIYVDFETQERLPKRSALAYKAIIENSGLLR